MKNRFIKKVLPIMLLVLAVFIIGSGCGFGGISEWWYEDADGDGYGIYDNRVNDANQPDGYVSDYGDCDDTNASVYPGATEIPDNLIDEDCNDFHAFTFYHDEDGDGFGNPDVSEVFEISFKLHQGDHDIEIEDIKYKVELLKWDTNLIHLFVNFSNT